MSYRRNYTGYVYYSGTKSYPASQSGGTVSYSGEVPVYITIDVDTDDFDASVNRCNNAVNGLTGAVVATEAAQVASKHEASRQIARTIVKGFFDFVGADLSQKIKELSSKCEALFFALMGHKENCLSKSRQMQDDYNRISKRYSKIFEDLDREMTSRIEAIDKPTFQFSDTAQGVIDRNTNSELLGISTVSSNESIKLETVLSCSHIKQQASNLLSKANNYLQGTYRLANSVRDMLSEQKGETEVMLPVMFVESVAAKGRNETKILGTDNAYTPSGKGVNAELRSDFLSKDLEWDNMPAEDYEKVISYLNVRLQNGGMEDRTLKTMLGLLYGQAIQTIKG